MEFVLDEVFRLLVDDDQRDAVGEGLFELSGERETGVSGSENGDAHTAWLELDADRPISAETRRGDHRTIYHHAPTRLG